MIRRALGRGLRRLRALAGRRPGSAPPVAPPPAVSAADQLALLRLARAAVVHQLGGPLGRALPAASASLLHRTDQVFVSFWVDGRLRGCCGVGNLSLHQNTLSAARRALEDERVEPLRREDVDRLRIEIDVLGAPAPVAARTTAQLERAIEPGIHGLVAQRGSQRAVFTGSVAIARNWGVEELVRRLCEKGGWAPDAYRGRGVEIFRFLSTTFIESADDGGARELLRGNVRIGPADWSRERIAAAIDGGADYLLRVQRTDGGFVYEHDPATGEDAVGDHIVRQLATTWVVASLARRRGTAREREALGRALVFIAAKTRPAARGSDLLVLSDEPDGAHLGAVAFALLTLVGAEDGALEGMAKRLAESILSLQRPDGGFDTHFPAATLPEAEDFYPGEAMLALMQLHERHPDPRYPEALRRALPYYRAHFRRERSAAFVPWQTAAYAHLFRLTGESEHADFVFELADAILPLQHVGADVAHADYVGGYRAGNVPGIAAATYNEGVLEAYDVARRRGDRERAARYQRAALLAALFTLRLQFTRENAFHVRHPDRALGAFRFSLADSALRIDHTQHALNSLLKVERHLFPAATPARAGSGDEGREECSLAPSGQSA
jgi:AmmeMemoRadiSam system protein A